MGLCFSRSALARSRFCALNSTFMKVAAMQFETTFIRREARRASAICYPSARTGAVRVDVVGAALVHEVAAARRLDLLRVQPVGFGQRAAEADAGAVHGRVERATRVRGG